MGLSRLFGVSIEQVREWIAEEWYGVAASEQSARVRGLALRLDNLGEDDFRLVELFTQLDVVHDEAKGYWEPRPWHEEFPQYPKTWAVDAVAVNSWGPINPDLIDH